MTLAELSPVHHRRRWIQRAAILLPVFLCIAVTVLHFGRSFTGASWRELLSGASAGDMQVAILYYSALPRLAIALLAGACLGLVSTVLQVVLRNPIAEPATLGMSGGASLAMTAASLWAPALLDGYRSGIAFAGSGLALLMVLGLAFGRTLSPLRLILGGLVVSLLCGSVNALLVLLHHDTLQGIFIWNAGSLVHNDWHATKWLAVEAGAALVFFLLLSRVLTVLHLEDDSARSLGLSLFHIRLAALIGTVLTTASVASAIGVVGFLGLASSTIARALGIRSFAGRLIASAAIGAALLATVDQGLQLLTGAFGEIPAGGLTALLGAPLMFWLLPRLTSPPEGDRNGLGASHRRGDHRLAIILPIVVLIALIWPAVMLTHDGIHWHLAGLSQIENALSWRGARTLAAASAGFLLGMAGTLMQRLTGNPLASPEALGISSGAAVGALASIMVIAQPDKATLVTFAALGALLTLVAVFGFARRAQFSPERMLLAGISVSTLFSGLVTFLLATGDPRMRVFIGWMAGSVSRATPTDAGIAFAIAVFAAILLPLLRRWLDIWPMGDITAQAVGVNRRRSRLSLFVIIAVMTAAPTMLVGPLSFVGLMAPHIVRMAGMTRAIPQCVAAGVTGALIVVAADLIGRTLLFPYEMPAGLMASLIGAPFFLWIMHRRST